MFVYTDNGCRDTINRIVTVNPDIQAGFNSLDSGCHPLNVAFQDQSLGVQTYNWTFGDGASSTVRNPSNLYQNNSQVNVDFESKLLVTNAYGCQDSITKNIRVFPKPIADFTLDTNRGCHPLQVNISNNSSLADSCRWVFGDGILSDTCFFNQSKIYQNTQSSVPVNYNTRLFVFTDHGCLDTSNRTVIVNPDIQAGFNSLDSGCHPLNVPFQDQSLGVQSYDWTFGDGANSTNINPSHVYRNLSQNDANFEAKLVVTNAYGCQDSIVKNIKVFAKPISGFTLDTNQGCHPLQVNINHTSIGEDSCSWIFGDGNLSDTCFSALLKTYTNTQSSQQVNYNARLFVFTDNGLSLIHI